jgi:hypothetical protein
MTVLEERGLFWWHHEPIPDGQFAPNSCVAGLLKIDDDGRTRLELDGYLPSEHGPMSALVEAEDAKLKGESIDGFLKVSKKHVLLCTLSRYGGRFSTNGLSYENYLALNCLVGDSKFPTNTMLFKELEIDLKGFEEWLRLGSTETSRTESSISVEYIRKNDVLYALQDGNISIIYDIFGPYFGKSKSDTLALNEAVSLIYSPKEPLTLEDMRIKFGLFEDLLY